MKMSKKREELRDEIFNHGQDFVLSRLGIKKSAVPKEVRAEYCSFDFWKNCSKLAGWLLKKGYTVESLMR